MLIAYVLMVGIGMYLLGWFSRKYYEQNCK